MRKLSEFPSLSVTVSPECHEELEKLIEELGLVCYGV